MRQLVHFFGQLPRTKRLAVALLVALLFLTWLAVCLVLASYWA